MRPPRNLVLQLSEGRAADARRNGRLRCEMIQSPLGDAVDLSTSGLRLRCRGKPPVEPGQLVKLGLQTLHGPMTVPTRIAWLRKVGFRRYEMGVQFLELTPEQMSFWRRVASASIEALTIGAAHKQAQAV